MNFEEKYAAVRRVMLKAIAEIEEEIGEEIGEDEG